MPCSIIRFVFHCRSTTRWRKDTAVNVTHGSSQELRVRSRQRDVREYKRLPSTTPPTTSSQTGSLCQRRLFQRTSVSPHCLVTLIGVIPDTVHKVWIPKTTFDNKQSPSNRFCNLIGLAISYVIVCSYMEKILDWPRKFFTISSSWARKKM